MATLGPRARAFSPALALCLALVGAASMLYYHQGLFIPRVLEVRASRGLSNQYSFGNDFYQVWISCQEMLLDKMDPYSPEITREIQTGLYGRPLNAAPGDPVDQRAFPYPAFVELLFWPTAGISFSQVRIGVCIVLALLTAGSVLCWFRALDWHPGAKWIAVAVLLTLSSYPALEGLYAGQLGLLVSFLLAAAVLAVQKNRFLLAGFLLAISMIKPQVVAIVALYLLFWSLKEWRVRWPLIVGFFSTLFLLMAASLAILPDWIFSWARTVLAYRQYTQPPLVREVLTSHLGPNLAEPAALLITAIFLAVGILFAWMNRGAGPNSLSFWLTLSLLLSGTAIVILPGLAIYDHLILLPAILIVIRHRNELWQTGPAARVLTLFGGMVLVWPLLASLVVILLRWIAPALGNSPLVFSLPIRTAASLPFAVLALVVWIKRFGNAQVLA